MKHGNKQVSQDGVESTAFLLQVGKLYCDCEVDKAAARAWHEQVKETIHSTSIGMKTVVSNSPNKEIHKQIKTNERNKLNRSGGENKSEEEKASKGQESRVLNTNSLSSNDKAKSGEYVLTRPPKSREEEKCARIIRQQLCHVRRSWNRRIVAKQYSIC